MKKLLLVLPALVLIFFLSIHATLANQNLNQCNSNNPDNCPSPTAICDNGEHTGNPHCHTPSPTPTIKPTPKPCGDWDEEDDDCLKSPTASPSATPTITPISSPTPEGEDTSTPSPQVEPNPGEAPSDPNCTIPGWIPVVTYLGQSGNTFSYSWTYPDPLVDQFWVNYGYSPNSLIYSELVTGNTTSITMDHEGMNWIEVAAYNNGCTGPFSNVVN